jgi:hypothetical protein
MGQVLGVGVTHYPPLLGRPDGYANLLRFILKSPLVPAENRNPESWPAPMQEEYGQEKSRAYEHQERLVAGFRRVRQAIDAFGPDAIVIFGDDQYENFREDAIPPFCVFLMDRFESYPFRHAIAGFGGADNPWGEPVDTAFVHRGQKDLAKHVATELIEGGFPITYAFTNSHYRDRGPTMLSHAFLNALLFLDCFALFR